MGTLSGNYYGGIVKNGLVLMLDAAKKDSYARLGTTWRDISFNGNNGTLTNFGSQTKWNSNNGGSIIFDGTDDQISIPNSSTYNNTMSKTVDVWINVGNIGNNFCIILTNRGVDDYNVNLTFLLDNRKVVRTWNPSGTDNMVLIYSMGTGTNGYYSFSKEKLGTTNGDSLWHNIVGVTDLTQNKLFLYSIGSVVLSKICTINASMKSIASEKIINLNSLLNWFLQRVNSIFNFNISKIDRKLCWSIYIM